MTVALLVVVCVLFGAFFAHAWYQGRRPPKRHNNRRET